MMINTKHSVAQRLNSAGKFITWVFYLTPYVSYDGIMAVPLRLQELRSPAMQPSLRSEFHELETLVPSTPSKRKIALKEHGHSGSEPGAAPDFFQLGSEIADNSSQAMYTALALLQGNTAIYQRKFANASSYMYTHHINDSTPIWPWIQLGSLIRKSNGTNKRAETANLTGGLTAHTNSVTVRKQADADSYRHLDKEERVALLKSVNKVAYPTGLPAFFSSIRKYIVGARHFMTVLDIATLTVAVLLCLYVCFVSRFGAAIGMRAQVKALRVSTGKNVQDLFEIKERYDCCHFEPLRPGVMLRLQGTVVVGSQGKLIAPLSRRDCVHFSASVSSKRHDGIHALPIAFHSVCVDFTLALIDAPHIQISVYGQDVGLFDMTKGTTQDHRRFSESPDHWQDFILTHRAPGHVDTSSASLRSENASLEFREVALFAGAIVTCVGELRRGHDGVLRLFPCEEVGAVESDDAPKPSLLGERWRTSWERPDAKNAKATDKVFISDDKQLLQAPNSGWAYLGCPCGRKENRVNDCEDDA
eukprot:gnl/MRDRNA2_/MRDRNA2_67786_c0_seq2.p1 gnl/MRDRNA2_/MRDRNA2_67786_c0~~gnl/MRDRNA2_/MRDRNA2_67786_c0_seq2.p1  ORF type:complete len:531 (-),score=79.50 gnl/MRDRNA2_/MRDRNA2_67786_c0_seq2:72-1664(-)